VKISINQLASLLELFWRNGFIARPRLKKGEDVWPHFYQAVESVLLRYRHDPHNWAFDSVYEELRLMNIAGENCTVQLAWLFVLLGLNHPGKWEVVTLLEDEHVCP